MRASTPLHPFEVEVCCYNFFAIVCIFVWLHICITIIVCICMVIYILYILYWLRLKHCVHACVWVFLPVQQARISQPLMRLELKNWAEKKATKLEKKATKLEKKIEHNMLTIPHTIWSCVVIPCIFFHEHKYKHKNKNNTQTSTRTLTSTFFCK